MKKIKEWLNKLKEEMLGISAFDLKADKVWRIATFGCDESLDKIQKSYIQRINSLIIYKANNGSKNLVIEMDDTEQLLKEAVINHFTKNGYVVKYIKGDEFGLKEDLLFLNWNNNQSDEKEN